MCSERISNFRLLWAAHEGFRRPMAIWRNWARVGGASHLRVHALVRSQADMAQLCTGALRQHLHRDDHAVVLCHRHNDLRMPRRCLKFREDS